jgi:hypothetical protein
MSSISHNYFTHVLNVVFGGILELGVLIVAKLVLLNFIKIALFGDSFKSVEYYIFLKMRRLTGMRRSHGNYVS